jgi:hypothetical protein
MSFEVASSKIISVFVDAIGDLSEFHAETADGVRATSQLQNSADRGRRWKALND